MKTLFRLFVFILLVGGWTLAAFSLHVVRKPGEMPLGIVTKNRLHWRETYVDTTRWTLEDVLKHAPFVERVIQTGNIDLLKHTVDPAGGDVEQQLVDALGRGDERQASGRPRPVFRWPWDK